MQRRRSDGQETRHPGSPGKPVEKPSRRSIGDESAPDSFASSAWTVKAALQYVMYSLHCSPPRLRSEFAPRPHGAAFHLWSRLASAAPRRAPYSRAPRNHSRIPANCPTALDLREDLDARKAPIQCEPRLAVPFHHAETLVPELRAGIDRGTSEVVVLHDDNDPTRRLLLGPATCGRTPGDRKENRKGDWSTVGIASEHGTLLV